MKGTFSGGTAASLTESVKAAKGDPEIFKLAINHYSLVPGFEGVKQVFRYFEADQLALRGPLAVQTAKIIEKSNDLVWRKITTLLQVFV